MPDPNELLNPYFIKESIVEFLKSTNEKYKNIDFIESDSQSLITDISSYLTILISNKFEQSLSDFYIQTQTNEKINLLLSQYGYKKSFGIPSQVNLSLFFDEKTMVQFNHLELENFIIPPLVLKVIDNNGNTWLNKNSILVTRTVERFGENKEFYKYRMSSQNGGSIFSFIQMKLNIHDFNVDTQELSRNRQLQEQGGYIIKDHYIDDFTRIHLDLNILKREVLEYLYNNKNIKEHIYSKFDSVNEIQNSKFHIDKYENFILNKYITISYNEVQDSFDIINGDDKYNGYRIKKSDLPLYLQYYNTKGENQNQLLGQVNRYQGIETNVLINGKVYMNYSDFSKHHELNIKSLFIPQKIKIKYNMITNRPLTQEELDNPKSEIFLFDLFNISTVNESMKFYGYSHINMIVRQEENVVVGKNQEQIEDIKHNFNQYIKQKNKIVTLLDIENYLNFFLRGFSYSLNQTSTYKHVLNRQYINGIENRLYILPQLFKDDNLKNVSLTKGHKILTSELVEDPIIYSIFNYTGEKFNIHEELKQTIISTVDVQFQKPQKIYIYTDRPIDVVQDQKISINSIFYGLKEKLDAYSDIKNNRYNVFDNINLIDILSVISEVSGIINIDMEKFLDSFNIIVENVLESNNILPLQYNVTENKPRKIKTTYLLPLTPQQEDENFISNTLSVFLFENQIGEVLPTGISEIFQEYKSYDNFIMQSPIQIKLLKEVVSYDYTIEPLYSVKDYVTPIPQIIDPIYSKIKINKDNFLLPDTTQCVLIKYVQNYTSFENTFNESIMSQSEIPVQVKNWLSS